MTISIQGVYTSTNFAVWSGVEYDIILGMAWLCQDAHIACKNCAIHDKISNGTSFFIKGTHSLPEGSMLSHLHIYIRPIGICQQILLVHVIELQNEIKVNKEEDVALDDGKLMLKNLKIHSMMK